MTHPNPTPLGVDHSTSPLRWPVPSCLLVGADVRSGKSFVLRLIALADTPAARGFVLGPPPSEDPAREYPTTTHPTTEDLS